MRACEYGNDKIVDCLIDNGANIKCCNGFGYHALIFACKNNKLETIKRLIEGGLDVNSHSKDGTTPLMMASEYNQLEVC